MPDARVSPRERLVLTAIIELYIATGEPVASQAVARFFADQEGLSSATIRNVMATLGEAGLLEQPHTSAGRVPTAAAFRYYVEQITQPGRMAAGAQPSSLGAMPQSASSLGRSSLSEARREQIEERFSGVASTNDYLERTSHVLALLSSGLGVALASSTAGQVLEHIHFSRLSTGRVLAVLVTQAGAVQDRVLALDRELNQIELETAARYLQRKFSRMAHRAHSRRSGTSRRVGARGVSPDAGLGRGALPSACKSSLAALYVVHPYETTKDHRLKRTAPPLTRLNARVRIPAHETGLRSPCGRHRWDANRQSRSVPGRQGPGCRRRH